jgi:single-strand DNA-binding protein
MKTITIAGNLGRDAETRRTQGGDAVTSFSVAVEDRQGKEKRTIWFDVSIWGKRGEALASYLTKGTRVAVAGDLSTREHEGKTYLSVRADQVTLLGGGSGQQAAANDLPKGQQYAYAGGRPSDDLGMDDVPFACEWRI